MRVKIHLLVILFFCIWNTKLVSAQGLISVKHYSIEDGLSQSKIQSILQDKEGYIWLGTWTDWRNSMGILSKTINLTHR